MHKLNQCIIEKYTFNIVVYEFLSKLSINKKQTKFKNKKSLPAAVYSKHSTGFDSAALYFSFFIGHTVYIYRERESKRTNERD